MIYIFHGNDADKRHDAYEKFLKSVSQSTEIFHVEKDKFDPSEMENFFSSSGLFFKKSIVICKDVFENEESAEFILGKINLIDLSLNDFVFIENKLNKNILQTFEKAGAVVKSFEAKEKQEKFNNFLLANAFGNREKLSLWIHFHQALKKGASLEELAGVLFWKAKDMILSRSFGRFREDELKGFASKISCLLPEARKKGMDDEVVFEQFLLEAF